MENTEPAQAICYLCGKTVVGPAAQDHVPPRQFYSKEIRKLHNPNLRTLPTHSACNRAYQLDEEYFIHSMAPLVLESYAGKSVLRELLSQYKKNRNRKLNQKILNEFEECPSGLYLPGDKVVKRMDAERIWRVVWKILRGLFYYEHQRFLPEDTSRRFKVVSPGYKPPDEFFLIPDDPICGQYPGVFDYKYRVFPEINNGHLWAMLFWDRLILLTIFHDPNCGCAVCKKS